MWRMRREPEPTDEGTQPRLRVVRGEQTEEGEVGHSTDDVAGTLALHAEAARLVAMALVGPADAEDAVQEALVRGWQSWGTLRDRTSVRAWLLRITINVCRDWKRGRFGTHRRLNSPLDDADQQPVVHLVSHPGATPHTAALDLRDAINQLDIPLRVVVVLRYYAGLDATEIGAALGIPSSTVRTRLSRALTLLRVLLGDSDEQTAISRQEDTGD